MKRVFSIIALAALLTGCAGTTGTMSVSSLIVNNRTNISKLSYGMSKEDVHAIMGQMTVKSASNPHRTSMFKTSDGIMVDVFFYWTEKAPSFVHVTDREMTPVVFNNGKVVGWGREFWHDYNKRMGSSVK